MLARLGGQSRRAAGGRWDRAGPEGGSGGAEMEEGDVGGAKMGGPSRDGDSLPQTRASRDGRCFLVVDDLLSKLGSPLSIGRGDAPPWESSPQQSKRSAQPSYWPDICDSDFGEFEAKVTEGEEGPLLEWLVDPEGALMVAFLEREAGRASERRGNRVTSSIWRAFPETERVKDGDLRMIAKEDGFVARDKNLAATKGSLSSCSNDGAVVNDHAKDVMSRSKPMFASTKADAVSSLLSPAIKKRAPSALPAGPVAVDSLLSTTTDGGRSYVHLCRLLQYIDVDEERAVRTGRCGVMQVRNHTYLQQLREHESHVFRVAVTRDRAAGGVPWLTSPEAALLIISYELKNSRASEDRAARARRMILRTFTGKDLERLDLEKLAVDLGVDDSRKQGKVGLRCFIAASSTSGSEDEGGNVEDGTYGASSSHARPLKKRAWPSTDEEEGLSSGSFIVKKRCDGECCVHVSRLHEYISNSVKEPGSKLLFHPKRRAYFRCLQKHDEHVFMRRVQGERGGSELLASAEASLLIISFELKSSRASYKRAERARKEIFRAFEGKGLEDLNLDELARELEVDDAGKDGTVPPPKRSKPFKYAHDANVDNGDTSDSSSSEPSSCDLDVKEKSISFVAASALDGKICFLLSRLLEYLRNVSNVKPRRHPYIQRLLKNEVLCFVRRVEGASSPSRMLSPKGALLVCHFEAKEGRCSDDCVNKARAVILQACGSQRLRSLDLEELARELRVDSSRLEREVLKSSSFVVQTKRGGKNCFLLTKLFQFIAKDQDRARSVSVKGVGKICSTYFLSLRKFPKHVFKDTYHGVSGPAWLASAEAALLVCHFELKAGRASKDRAEEARGEILRACRGKGHEELDLDELARELGVDDSCTRAESPNAEMTSSETSSSDSDEGDDKGHPGTTSSSLVAVSSRKRAQSTPLPLNAEQAGCFVVKAKSGGKTCVHLSRLFSFFGSSAGKSKRLTSRHPYLPRIQDHQTHLFAGTIEGSCGKPPWLASPEAALLICNLEQQAGRASDDRAAQARVEIRRACGWLEGLDLDKLAVELGIDNECKMAKARNYESTSSESSSSASGDDGGEHAVGGAESSAKWPSNSGSTSHSKPAGRDKIVRTGQDGGSSEHLSSSASSGSDSDDRFDSKGLAGVSSSSLPSSKTASKSALHSAITEASPFMVTSMRASRICAHLSRLYEFIDKDKGRALRTSVHGVMQGRNYAYLGLLEKSARHIFKDAYHGGRGRALLASAEAALLILHEELQAERASEDLAQQAEKQIRRVCIGMGLEDLDLGELARELGLSHERKKARSQDSSPSGRGKMDMSISVSPTTSSHRTKLTKSNRGGNEVKGEGQAGAVFNVGKPSVTCKRKAEEAEASEDKLDEPSFPFKKQPKSCGHGDREQGAGHSSADEGMDGTKGLVSPAWSAHSTTAADGLADDDDEIDGLRRAIAAEQLEIKRLRAESGVPRPACARVARKME